jgi:hypothetical protein
MLKIHVSYSDKKACPNSLRKSHHNRKTDTSGPLKKKCFRKPLFIVRASHQDRDVSVIVPDRDNGTVRGDSRLLSEGIDRH